MNNSKLKKLEHNFYVTAGKASGAYDVFSNKTIDHYCEMLVKLFNSDFKHRHIHKFLKELEAKLLTEIQCREADYKHNKATCEWIDELHKQGKEFMPYAYVTEEGEESKE